MGLMQLLTVGRSLGRIRGEPGRYRMTQQSLLPRFGSVNAHEERARGLSEKTNPVVVKTEAKTPEIATATNDRKNMNAVQPSSQVTPASNAAVPRPAFPRADESSPPTRSRPELFPLDSIVRGDHAFSKFASAHSRGRSLAL